MYRFNVNIQKANLNNYNRVVEILKNFNNSDRLPNAEELAVATNLSKKDVNTFLYSMMRSGLVVQLRQEQRYKQPDYCWHDLFHLFEGQVTRIKPSGNNDNRRHQSRDDHDDSVSNDGAVFSDRD